MAFFSARILSKDGMVIADEVEVWIDLFHIEHRAVWDGSFAVPVTTPLGAHTYRLQLADGREGEIINITTHISGDNIMVYFEGDGSLQS